MMNMSACTRAPTAVRVQMVRPDHFSLQRSSAPRWYWGGAVPESPRMPGRACARSVVVAARGRGDPVLAAFKDIAAYLGPRVLNIAGVLSVLRVLINLVLLSILGVCCAARCWCAARARVLLYVCPLLMCHS